MSRVVDGLFGTGRGSLRKDIPSLPWLLLLLLLLLRMVVKGPVMVIRGGGETRRNRFGRWRSTEVFVFGRRRVVIVVVIVVGAEAG